MILYPPRFSVVCVTRDVVTIVWCLIELLALSRLFWISTSLSILNAVLSYPSDDQSTIMPAMKSESSGNMDLVLKGHNASTPDSSRR